MRRHLLAVLAVLLLAAAPALAAETRPVPAGNARATSGPALLRPSLTSSLRCAGDVAGSPLTPVLLLHGTGSTPEESWGPVYVPRLRATGRPVCTVQLPERATTDMQVSTEVVVAAVRAVAARRHGRIDVVGHSQGATLAVTALKFWPDLPGLVEDYVGLAPTFNVGVTGEVMCQRPCSAPFQQRRAGSRYFAGVRSHPLPPGPSYTTIATLTDEIATPEPEASRLDGARNVVLQERCPAKAVDHFALVTDGTVFALVLDGLTHAGTVDPARVPTSACLDTLPPGTDPVAVAPLVAQAVANDLAANQAAEKLDREPPVRCYTSARCADVDDRGRLLASARLSGRRLVLEAQAPGRLTATVLGADGRVLATRSRDLPVGASTLDLPVSGSSVRLSTTTSFYRVAAAERVLAGTAQEQLPLTGGTPLVALGLLAVAGAVLLRRRA
ncbi:MAG: Conserved putative secreted protein [Frankiales bacterium]|nr:Conserved putative secreted protein [Frankiales bacterium]